MEEVTSYNLWCNCTLYTESSPMGESSTGFLTNHQQKCLWDLVIPFQHTGRTNLSNAKQAGFCHKNTGGFGEQCFPQPHHPPETEKELYPARIEKQSLQSLLLAFAVYDLRVAAAVQSSVRGLVLN